jgi:hypothetical protein
MVGQVWRIVVPITAKEALAAGTNRSLKMLSPRNQVNGAVNSIYFDVFCVVNLYTMARTAMIISE